MPAHAESLGDRIIESLRFWAIVTVVCGVVALAGYAFGKEWLGARLHEMEVRRGAPEITPEVRLPVSTGEDASEQSPPVKPIIVVQEREPSGRERREVERELVAQEAQDGAQLHAREAERERPTEPEAREVTTEPSTPATPEPSEEPARTGRYVVTAGSFADETNARKVIRQLSAQGYHPYTTPVEKDGIAFRRVNVAICETRQQAEQLQSTLQSLGHASAVWPE